MAVRVIKKSLAGSEDLLLGFGTEVQVRNDKNIEITKINASNIPYDENKSISEVITNKVDTIAGMRAMNKLPETIGCSGYNSKNDGAFGSHFYRLKGLKTAEIDNSGTVIIVSVGGSDYVYELQYEGAVNVKWFGAKGDGITDDTVAIQSAVNSSKMVSFEIGATFLITSTITCSIFGQTLTANGSLYSTSNITYTGNGAAFIFEGTTNYASILDGIRIQGVPATSTDYYNTGSVGVDITSGNVAIRVENSWICNFETLILSNWNSFYNSFRTSRFEKAKTILSSFSNNNLVFEGNRCVRFNTAITTNGSDGPTNIINNSFEVFNGSLHNATGDEKGTITFVGNYVEDYYTEDLPTNFPQATGMGAQFPTKFGQYSLFIGNYGILTIKNNDFQIPSIFRVVAANLVTKLVMKDNKISLAQSGNNIDRLVSFTTTDLKHLEIADTLRYTGILDAGFTRTYTQNIATLSTVHSNNYHYFYDCVSDSYYKNKRAYKTPTLLNGYTTVAGELPPTYLIKDGVLELFGVVSASAATSAVLFTDNGFTNITDVYQRGSGVTVSGAVVTVRLLSTGDVRIENYASIVNKTIYLTGVKFLVS